MAIDFNKANCNENTSEKVFGICDDQPEKDKSKEPAYLDFKDSDNWIVWVENDLRKQVRFTAIDHCLDNIPATSERCDGMLQYDSTIIFVELKDSDGGRWLGKARDQLIATTANTSLYQKFEDKTSFVLKVEHVIKIE